MAKKNQDAKGMKGGKSSKKGNRYEAFERKPGRIPDSQKQTVKLADLPSTYQKEAAQAKAMMMNRHKEKKSSVSSRHASKPAKTPQEMQQEYEARISEYTEMHFPNNADQLKTQMSYNIDYILDTEESRDKYEAL